MAGIKEIIQINCPLEEVYLISQDYSVRFDWDPFPDRLEMLGGEAYVAKIGGRVFIRSKLGMQMIVEFVQVKPPYCAAVKMISGPWLLTKFAGSWHYQHQHNDRTLVRFRYVIKTQGGILIESLATWYFRRVVKKRLIGLKRYCEKHHVS